MDILKEVTDRLLGTVSAVDYLVLSIFILIGITLSIRIDTFKRDKTCTEERIWQRGCKYQDNRYRRICFKRAGRRVRKS